MSAISTAGSGTGTSAGRYRVQSVDRAVDVIEALAAADGGLGVTELARELGRAKSAVFAILQTLEERGLVESSGVAPARRYFLGLALARLGPFSDPTVTCSLRAHGITTGRSDVQ